MKAVILTLGAALMGAASLFHATDGLRAFTAEGARRVAVAETQPIVPDFLVENMSGVVEPLRPKADEIVLVEFIYTTCPTICQTAGGEFSQLRDALAKKGLTARMLSVSFDPETDDLEAMQGYAALHGASGDPWTVARLPMDDLTTVLKFFRVTVIPDDWGGYQHNTAVLLINGHGRLAGKETCCKIVAGQDHFSIASMI